MRNHKTIASSSKKSEVKKLAELIQRYRVIGIADMTGMPSPQLQKMRFSLRGTTDILMSKGSLIKLAFGSLKSKINGIENLEVYIKGMPALVLTNDNPFKLASVLNKNKSSAPAKAGQKAPNDIWVRAGSTQFPPGPLLGELGAVGLQAFVDQGKIAIRADKLLVKEGEIINAKVAGALSRLGIEPMEIGINLIATLENGEVLTKKILFIDVKEYFSKFVTAQKEAFNLAFSSAFPTKENISLLMQKAQREAKAVLESAKIDTPEAMGKKIASAETRAESLKSKLNIETNMQEKNEAHQKENAEKINVPEINDKIKQEEEVAQDILKKLQDAKLRSGGR